MGLCQFTGSLSKNGTVQYTPAQASPEMLKGGGAYDWALAVSRPVGGFGRHIDGRLLENFSKLKSGVPARRQIPQPSRLEKSGLLNQKEGKETWFEVN